MITAEVDLRGLWHDLRDQGDRSTCLACATSDAHAALRSSPPLSAEFLFYHAIRLARVGNVVDGITLEEASAALTQAGQPAEAEWPYSPVQPDPWAPPSVTDIWFGSLDRGNVNPANAISAAIRLGQPVVLGIRLSAAFLGPAQSDFTIPSTGAGFGGHAVLVVGLGSDPHGESFLLIRNSWGNKWGDGGHAWLAANYLTDKFISFASVIPRI